MVKHKSADMYVRRPTKTRLLNKQRTGLQNNVKKVTTQQVHHCSELAICCFIVLRCLDFITGVHTIALHYILLPPGLMGTYPPSP